MSPATNVSSTALTKQDEVDVNIDIEAEQYEQRAIRRIYIARRLIEALVVLCLVLGIFVIFIERNNGSKELSQTLVKAVKVIVALVNIIGIYNIVENIRLQIWRGRRPHRAIRQREAAAPAMSLRRKVKCGEEEVKGEEVIHTKPEKGKRDDNLLEEKIIYVKPQEIRCDDDEELEEEEEEKVIYIKPKFSRGDKKLLPVAEIRLDD